MSAEANNETRLRIAVVQMDANPAPTIDRLKRAERLVTGAVESGAHLMHYSQCTPTHKRPTICKGDQSCL